MAGTKMLEGAGIFYLTIPWIQRWCRHRRGRRRQQQRARRTGHNGHKPYRQTTTTRSTCYELLLGERRWGPAPSCRGEQAGASSPEVGGRGLAGIGGGARAVPSRGRKGPHQFAQNSYFGMFCRGKISSVGYLEKWLVKTCNYFDISFIVQLIVLFQTTPTTALTFL